jgi:hypothetical protein
MINRLLGLNSEKDKKILLFYSEKNEIFVMKDKKVGRNQSFFDELYRM